MKQFKVFGIGFHKTGTTSLARALTLLGYRVTGPNFIQDKNLSRTVLKRAVKVAGKFDAFQDNPWPLLYREMDTRYPGSKFVLTVRDPDKWIRSQVTHFGKKTTPMREWIYGVGFPEGNEDTYLSRYHKHNDDVVSYFSNRPRDLLVMNLEKGDGWEKLCPFLGADVIRSPFPHANRASDRKE